MSTLDKVVKSACKAKSGPPKSKVSYPRSLLIGDGT